MPKGTSSHSTDLSCLLPNIFAEYNEPRGVAQDFGLGLQTLDCLLGLYWTGLTLLDGFSFLVNFFFLFYFGSCGRLSWLNCQLSSAR